MAWPAPRGIIARERHRTVSDSVTTASTGRSKWPPGSHSPSGQQLHAEPEPTRAVSGRACVQEAVVEAAAVAHPGPRRSNTTAGVATTSMSVGSSTSPPTGSRAPNAVSVGGFARFVGHRLRCRRRRCAAAPPACPQRAAPRSAASWTAPSRTSRRPCTVRRRSTSGRARNRRVTAAARRSRSVGGIASRASSTRRRTSRFAFLSPALFIASAAHREASAAAITSRRSAGPAGRTTNHVAPAASKDATNGAQLLGRPRPDAVERAAPSRRAQRAADRCRPVLPHQRDAAPRGFHRPPVGRLAQPFAPWSGTPRRRDPTRSTRRPPGRRSPPPGRTDLPPRPPASPGGRNGPAIGGTCDAARLARGRRTARAAPRPSVPAARAGRRPAGRGCRSARARGSEARSPVPSARIARPPDIASSAAACFARIPGRTKRDAGHHGPDVHPRVARRHRREQRERLQRGSVRTRGRIEDRREEVVGREHPVDARARAPEPPPRAGGPGRR